LQRPCVHRLQETYFCETRCRGASTGRRCGHPSKRTAQARRAARSPCGRGMHCTGRSVPRAVWPVTAFLDGTDGWCCMTRIFASAAGLLLLRLSSGAARNIQLSNFGSRGQDGTKCTTARRGRIGNDGSIEEYQGTPAPTGMLRGKLPLCAEMCPSSRCLQGGTASDRGRSTGTVEGARLWLPGKLGLAGPPITTGITT